jgi:hypothetical protein
MAAQSDYSLVLKPYSSVWGKGRLSDLASRDRDGLCQLNGSGWVEAHALAIPAGFLRGQSHRWRECVTE